VCTHLYYCTIILLYPQFHVDARTNQFAPGGVVIGRVFFSLQTLNTELFQQTISCCEAKKEKTLDQSLLGGPEKWQLARLPVFGNHPPTLECVLYVLDSAPARFGKPGFR
jgi:hypothetical protein